MEIRKDGVEIPLEVKTSPSNAGHVGSMPGGGAKLPHISYQKKSNRSNTVMNSIKA